MATGNSPTLDPSRAGGYAPSRRGHVASAHGDSAHEGSALRMRTRMRMRTVKAHEVVVVQVLQQVQLALEGLPRSA